MAQKRQRQNKIDVVKDFIEIAGEGLEKRFGSSPTCKDVVRHFVERGIIDPKRLRNYMVIASDSITLTEFCVEVISASTTTTLLAPPIAPII